MSDDYEKIMGDMTTRLESKNCKRNLHDAILIQSSVGIRDELLNSPKSKKRGAIGADILVRFDVQYSMKLGSLETSQREHVSC